jgi:hypothetical protein
MNQTMTTATIEADPALPIIRITRWDATTGGSRRFVGTAGGEEYGFHGCFHELRPDRIAQTFTWEIASEGAQA